jgi:hypothetical protein
MTIDSLTKIKSVAKQFARTQRIKHIAALELIAGEMGKPHWRGLAEAYKLGWRPTPEQLERLDGMLSDHLDGSALEAPGQAAAINEMGNGLVFTRWVPEDVSAMEADEIHGRLDGHPFYLVGDEFSVAFGSQGWEIILDQPPSAKPEFRRLGGRVKSVAALDPAFAKRAIQLLRIRARRMHAEVASDWPRRSTMPDHEGQALHPLGNGLSAEWYCQHCDGVHGGRTMASNLWHCPSCGATPIDIFATPFWSSAEKSS